MVKGSCVQVMRLKKPNSRYFAEVLFVLRDGCDPDTLGTDAVAEAERILEEQVRGRGQQEKTATLQWPAFLLGVTLSLLVCLPLILGRLM